jgi:hypothetical protein
MRFLILPLLLCLAACGSDPRVLGITGPGQIEQPRPAQETLPGGDIAQPQSVPNTGNGKFWGYN